MTSAQALADALPDFGRRPNRTPPPSAEPAGSMPPAMEQPAIDFDAILAAEIERAEAALGSRLAEAHCAELEGERLRHAEEIAALQREFGSEAGQRITEAMSGMEERVVSLVTSTAARILLPVLTAELRARSIARLEQAVRAALGETDALRVTVSGAPSLYEALATAMPDRARCLHFVEAPGFDLAVTIGDSLLETRLGEWSDALAELVKDGQP